MSLEENLDRVLARHQELQDLMASAEPPSPEEFARLSKEFSDLTPVVEAIGELCRAKDETADLATLIAEPETDAEITPCVLGRTGLAEEGRQRLFEGFRHDHTPGVAGQRVDQPQCRSYGRDPFSGYAAELRQTA